jgi:hypothetical protein
VTDSLHRQFRGAGVQPDGERCCVEGQEPLGKQADDQSG